MPSATWLSTSVRAVENALNINIPENANTIRNIMQLTLYVHDHLVHFYHLHALDWVDVVSALSADPGGAASLQRTLQSRRSQSSLQRVYTVIGSPDRPRPVLRTANPSLAATRRDGSFCPSSI